MRKAKTAITVLLAGMTGGCHLHLVTFGDGRDQGIEGSRDQEHRSQSGGTQGDELENDPRWDALDKH